MFAIFTFSLRQFFGIKLFNIALNVTLSPKLNFTSRMLNNKTLNIYLLPTFAVHNCTINNITLENLIAN